MAARHLPHVPEGAVALTIAIDGTNTAHPQAVRIAGGPNQQITFTNNSGGTISIQFEPNPPGPTMFSNIIGLANGATDTQTANVDLNGNGAVNYYVYDANNNPYGPFGIEIGNGPLYVSVTYNAAKVAGQCTPDPIALPSSAHLVMYSTDYNYTVKWPTSFGDPFSPLLTSVVPGAPNNSPVQEVANLQSYSYTVKSTNPVLGTGNGGGRVIVKGS
ncbi:MAG TPA: hypothetical protein VKR59_16315 [Terriglobales bacterium]|nr:hypothetical protein [Terriglobales bacterium]